MVVVSQYCRYDVVCVVGWCCYDVIICGVFFVYCQSKYVYLVNDVYWIVGKFIVGNQYMMQCRGVMWYVQWFWQYVFGIYIMINIGLYGLLDVIEIFFNFFFVMQCQFVLYYYVGE